MSGFLNGFTLEGAIGKNGITREKFNQTFTLVIPATLHQDAYLGNLDDDEEEIVFTNEDEIIGNVGFIVYYTMDGDKLTPIYESKDGDNVAEQIKKVFHITN